jgi:hypothetical protein
MAPRNSSCYGLSAVSATAARPTLLLRPLQRRRRAGRPVPRDAAAPVPQAARACERGDKERGHCGVALCGRLVQRRLPICILR